MNRELSGAIGLSLVGSAVALLASSRGWVHYEIDHGPTLPVQTKVMTGADLAPGVRALAWVGIAGVVALLATRRWGRTAVGVILTACGGGIAVTALAHRTADVGHPVTTTWWPFLVLLGGLLLLAAGGLTAVRGHRWPSLSEAYRTPAARAADAPVTDKGVWDALDRGEDPTA